ncbi:MAG: arginine--tRNA ligase [Candidatus Liptonbacteria bacterium]|nr:arginine--tRNA ligase [Candidatus Liptonbacteria bacterium]
MRGQIIKILKKVAPYASLEVNVPEVSEFGHFSTNIAMRLASEKGRKPLEVAGELVSKILKVSPRGFFERIEVAGQGFINFWIEKSVLQKELLAVHEKKGFGKSKAGKGKKVIVEYSSPNIAKPMHVGHLRSTLIGDALANIHEFLGYEVIRWNYLGDWGTQFGKLISAYKLWGKRQEVEKAPIGTLLKLYVKFHEELDKQPELEEMGREEFRKFEEGDHENRRLWLWFRRESLREFNAIYKRLGVKFDVTLGESFYEKGLKPLIERLIRRGIAKESEGALIAQVGELPPALIRKSDGATLYITRDLANIEYRVKKYKPAKILYVVANEQALHFEQLFAIARLIGIRGVEFEHVKFGLVLGEGGEKFSTREGKTIHLEEVIEKIIRLAQGVVSKKNPGLSEREKKQIAEAVGIGALKYNDLREHRHSDLVFDWNRMLDFTGDSAPYIQYTYARMQSIKRKVRAGAKPDASLLELENELSVLRKVLDFPYVVTASAEALTPNTLARYTYELAVLANKFYETTPVMKEEDVKLRAARLVLVDVAAGVLKRALNLLGVSTPSRL